jgi:lipopolysaccharide exporter
LTAGVQTKMAKGAAWMVLFKLGERSIGLISTLVLARLLNPEDFGVVAMALSFLFLAEQLTAMGLDFALIQNQEATRAHYDSAWTGQLLLGAVITLFMIVAAQPIAAFYQKPELVWVVVALSVHPILNALCNIGTVAFRKDLDFRKEFIYQLSKKALGFLIVVPAAFILQSYWALVVGILASQLISVVISYMMHPYRPRCDLSRFRELFRFSRWLLVNNFVGYFKVRSADFIVGRSFGASALGTYNVAYELAHLPSTELTMPINRALMPGFAKLHGHHEISEAYANALGLMALLAVPCAAGLAVLAPFFVPTVLGLKWLDASPLIQVLAFNGALLMFHSPITSLLIARNKPAMATLGNAVYLATLLAALFVASTAYAELGAQGAAFAAVVTSVVTTPVYLLIVWRTMAISPMVFIRAVLRPAVASVVMAALLFWFVPTYDVALGAWRTLGWLVGGIAIGAVCYVVVIAVLWLALSKPKGSESLMVEQVKSLWLRRVWSAS